jgi:dipeptidase E
MKRSGFDLLATPLIRNNKLVYGGFSAGAVVAGPTLRGIELVDDSQEIPEGYDPEVVWEGLGLVDFSIAPHYKSDHRDAPSIELVVKFFEDGALPYKALADGQALLVTDDEVELLPA